MKLSKLSFAFSYVLIPLIIIICVIVLNHGCDDNQDVATPFSPGKTTSTVDGDTTTYIGWKPNPLNNNGVRGDTVVKRERQVGGLNMKQ